MSNGDGAPGGAVSGSGAPSSGSSGGAQPSALAPPATEAGTSSPSAPSSGFEDGGGESFNDVLSGFGAEREDMGPLMGPPPAQPLQVAPVPPAATPVAAAVPAVSEGATGPRESPQQGVSRVADPQDLLTPAEPGRIAQAIEQNRAALVESVAGALFGMSAEDVEALETSPTQMIPKLLARGYVESQRAMLHQLQQSVPLMIQGTIEAMRSNAQNEGKFFARWPDLRANEHADVVRRYASAYRKMHPGATLEQMIEDLGPMVMMAARVRPQSATPSGNGIPAPVPPRGFGVAPPASPFVPAVSGPAARHEAPTLSDWDVLGFTGE